MRVLLKHVSRRKIPLEVFSGLVTRLVEVDAKATNWPVWLTDGPAVERVGVPPHAGRAADSGVGLRGIRREIDKQRQAGQFSGVHGESKRVGSAAAGTSVRGIDDLYLNDAGSGRSPPSSVACSPAELKNVVVRAAPLTVTTESGTKPVPVSPELSARAAGEDGRGS